jgi:hypothetical protein
MKKIFHLSLASLLLGSLSVLSSPSANAAFANECITYAGFGLDNTYIVYLHDAQTGQRSADCVADDWTYNSPAINAFTGLPIMQTQEVMYTRDAGGRVNVRAIRNGEYTADNWIDVPAANSADQARKNILRTNNGTTKISVKPGETILLNITDLNYTGPAHNWNWELPNEQKNLSCTISPDRKYQLSCTALGTLPLPKTLSFEATLGAIRTNDISITIDNNAVSNLTGFADRCATFGVNNGNGTYTVELVETSTDLRSAYCKAEFWTYNSAIVSPWEQMSTTDYSVTYRILDGGAVNVRAQKGVEWTNDNYLIIEAPSASNTLIECSSTAIAEGSTFTFELVGANGKRTTDCRFTKWDVKGLSGTHKLLEMTEYSLKFDNTLKGVVGVFITEPTPFETELHIGKGGSFTTTVSCKSPLTQYNGKCVDPIPACQNPPAHYIPASCIDKIENGKLIERYNFQCLSGYERVGDKCITTATAVPSTPMAFRISNPNSGYSTTDNEYYFGLQWTEIPGAQYSMGYIIMDPNNSMLIGKSPGLGGLTQPFTSVTNIDPGYKYLITVEAYDPIRQNFLGRDEVSIYVEKSTAANQAQSQTTRNRIIPPAGYEDEVRTDYSAAEKPFDDIDTTTLTGLAASELYYRAIIGGYRNPDATKKPIFDENKSVNRAEAAKFLLLARGFIFSSSSSSITFRDVLDGQWYTEYVLRAAELGVISGHPDGTFRPGDGVQVDQFLKMISKTFNIPENLSHSYTDVASDAWFNVYAGAAKKYDLFPNGSRTRLNPGHQMTRGEVAIAIYQYLKNR